MHFKVLVGLKATWSLGSVVAPILPRLKSHIYSVASQAVHDVAFQPWLLPPRIISYLCVPPCLPPALPAFLLFPGQANHVT